MAGKDISIPRKSVGQQVADRAFERAVSVIGPLAPPYLVGGVLLGAASAMHTRYGGSDITPWITMGETAAGMGLAGFTYVISHAKSALGRIHSTVTVLGATALMAAGTITGPFAEPTSYGVLFAGVPLAISWNMRRAVRAGDFADTAAAMRTKWHKGGLAEMFGFTGSKWRTGKEGEHRSESTVKLRPGQLADDFTRELPRIASALQVRRGSLSAIPDEDDPTLVRVTHIKGGSIAKKLIGWPGPSNPGACIYASPLITGVAADWQKAGYSPADTHVLLTGTSGAAKSFGGGWNISAEVMSRTNAVLWGADATKSLQTFGPMLAGMERCAPTKATAKLMLKVIHAVIPERTKAIGAAGFQSWHPDCGLSYVVALLEEASDMFTMQDLNKLLSIGKAARSAGIHLVVSLQRATFDQIPTTLRAMLNSYIAFGINDEADNDFSLPKRAIDAGADPSKWGDRRPGMHYIAAKDTPDERLAVENRAYLITGEQMRAHAEAFGPGELDAITTKAAINAVGQAAWESLSPASPRFVGLNDDGEAAAPAAAASTAGPTATTTGAAADDKEEPTEMEMEATPYNLADDDEWAAEAPTTPDEDTDIPGDPSVAPPVPTRKLSFGPPATARDFSPDKAREMVRAAVEEMGEVPFQRHQVIKTLAPMLNKSRPWYSERLKELVDDGTLVYDPEDQTYARRSLIAA